MMSKELLTDGLNVPLRRHIKQSSRGLGADSLHIPKTKPIERLSHVLSRRRLSRLDTWAIEPSLCIFGVDDVRR